MAVLAECPICHRKQSARNKNCACGKDLDKAKRSKLVRYWIQYRLPGGKQRKEFVGDSIEEARDADGKRRVQKRENRIFDIKPEAKMTFRELADWYLGLEKVKVKKGCWRIRIALENFNSELGDIIVGQIKPVDLENYQVKRIGDGKAGSTVDKELSMVQTMINKAFDNGKVGGETLRTFKRVENLLKKNANARDRILSLNEYHRLMTHLPFHLMPVVATAFYTGMRRGEILGLTWDKVDLQARLISLEAEDTKDNEPRNIPILDELYGILKSIPRAIHDNHVFQHNGKPIKGDIRTALKSACEKAGISYGQRVKGGFVFHDLRHSFNTHMRKAGVPETVIMKITGHATRQMFDRYNTVDMEDARKAVDQLQGYFANVTQTVTQVGKSE
jgi:integrase